MVLYNNSLKNNRESESGNVIAYILIAVVLFGALTAAMMRGGGEQAAATSSFRIAEDLVSQAQGIRSAILECALVYRSGGELPEVASSGTAETLENVTCEPTNGNEPFKVFVGRSSVYKPRPPVPFEEWLYNNDDAGHVTISTQVPEESVMDFSVRDALERVMEKYSDNETEIICNGAQGKFTVYLTGIAPEDSCP